MTPTHFLRMVRAELRAVFGRWSGRAALVLALLVAFGALAAMEATRKQMVGANFNGMPVEAMVDFTWRGVAGWALKARNFFVLPMVLVLAAAATVTGEVRERTLREDLSRPVPRWSVLAAKLTALLTLSGATLVLTAVPVLVGGAILYGTDGSIVDVLLGYLASWLSDLGLFAMTLAVAVFLRSVGGVVVSLVLYLMVDTGVRGLLGLLGALKVSGASELGRFLPGSALACWEGWTEGWAVEPFVGLALLVAAGIGVALVRLQRMDVA